MVESSKIDERGNKVEMKEGGRKKGRGREIERERVGLFCELCKF